MRRQEIIAALLMAAAVIARLVMRAGRKPAAPSSSAPATEAERERPDGMAAQVARQVREDVKAGKVPKGVSAHAAALADARWQKAKGAADGGA